MNTKPREKTRAELLADLADNINELVEPRHHTEMLIKTVIESIDANGGRRRKAKRTRQRQRHTVTLPALLESLRSASVPGSCGSGSGSGSFESRPAAELEALGVIRDIAASAGTYAAVLGVKRGSLDSTLRALVGAQHSDEQLRNLVRDANRWVKKARIATGFDAAPITLGDACVDCGKRNSLVVTGDLLNAKCSRCGSEWTPDTIGQLAELLRVNQTQETAIEVPCWWPSCTRRGVHDVHQNGQGQTWRDTCDVTQTG